MSDTPDAPDVSAKPDKNERIRLPATVSTPEQGCIGCSIAVTMVVLSVTFWLIYWWRNEPNLHLKMPTPSPSASPSAGATVIPTAQPTLRYNRPIPQN